MMDRDEKNYFFEKLYGGEEIIFIVQKKKYFVQGYHKNGLYHMNLQEWEPVQQLLWETQKSNMAECAEEFLEISIFNGKTFWEVENEIEWVDE